jgi:hypothetical protein
MAKRNGTYNLLQAFLPAINKRGELKIHAQAYSYGRHV